MVRETMEDGEGQPRRSCDTRVYDDREASCRVSSRLMKICVLLRLCLKEVERS
jgi:hypothetical protein